MKLLSDFIADFSVNNSKLELDNAYIIENLSTYALIKVNINDNHNILYNYATFKLFDNNYEKSYTSSSGFKLKDIINCIIDFENTNPYSLTNKNITLDELFWNNKREGFNIKWV